MKRRKVWIDLDNTPHVPFFRPIIEELKARDFEIIVTARDAYGVRSLVDYFSLPCTMIGRHYGRSKAMKGCGLAIRAIQLLREVAGKKPNVAISHGSRSLTIAASILRIPSVLIFDYEYATPLRYFRPTLIMVPEIIPDATAKLHNSTVFKYTGLKEDVYVPFFQPDTAIKEELNLDQESFIVTIRPPATEAHYFVQESEMLFEDSVNYLIRRGDTQSVIVPRNSKQAEQIKLMWPEAIASRRIIIPQRAVNGLDLMWFSDFVLSGGGTMNREAAALGVPVYSIYKGKIGAVDRYLSERGKLVILESADEIERKIVFLKTDKRTKTSTRTSIPLQQIVDKIAEMIS